MRLCRDHVQVDIHNSKGKVNLLLMATRNTNAKTQQATPPAPPAKSEEEELLDRLQREMDEDDGSPPPMWDPEPNESLLAELVRYEERTTKVGPCRVAVVREVGTEELLSVWLSRSVLKNEFEKQSPRPGDMLGLKYHGERTSRNGQSTYFLYTLRVVRTKAGDVFAQQPVSPVVVVNADDDEEIPM